MGVVRQLKSFLEFEVVEIYFQFVRGFDQQLESKKHNS
jgi:hypothetical protein